MRKLITLTIAITALLSCNNQNGSAKKSNVLYNDGISKIEVTGGMTTKPKVRVDSSYAIYSLGNSIEAFTSKVFIVYHDTTLMRDIDSVTQKKVDTTTKTYFIPRLDTAFFDQQKRVQPLFDEKKKVKMTILWYPIDEKYILKDFKK